MAYPFLRKCSRVNNQRSRRSLQGRRNRLYRVTSSMSNNNISKTTLVIRKNSTHSQRLKYPTKRRLITCRSTESTKVRPLRSTSSRVLRSSPTTWVASSTLTAPTARITRSSSRGASCCSSTASRKNCRAKAWRPPSRMRRG